ncbi:gephyrin-like molybdotransferase Glp [uncultured Maricaulis sp.]|uniref:molybdopterin molybdotransferase MoeA n=1 Tax=uncultured Maricaulis sp. TaxID=174710 RepID=UPI0030D6DECA|tara:strand:- start:15772 stop:16980 length:1209 start_codon:yes stop_codon:yes gene_type:complete
MISLDEARAILIAALTAGSAETVDYSKACGRVLAEPLLAKRTQPPFDASAMDGYAIRSADLAQGPASFELTGESAAGARHYGDLRPGQAIRISTGAPMPNGADQVVMQERAKLDAGQVHLDDTCRPNSNVRKAGIDFEAGKLLLPAGTRLTPDAIGLAVGAGLTELTVHVRPRVGILSTGDELVEPGEATGPDQIINSISKALDGLVRQWGGEPVYLGIARDSPAAVRAKLDAAAGLDLLVTIGGASVGDHDHLRQVFNDAGGQLTFEKIAVKPGKPTWFGALGRLPILGLPGNPVSSLVMARLCLLPVLQRLTGQPPELDFGQARLGADLEENGSRENFVRAIRDPSNGTVAPLGNQDSSALSALSQADCLIRRAADAPAALAGGAVEILPLKTSRYDGWT